MALTQKQKAAKAKKIQVLTSKAEEALMLTEIANPTAIYIYTTKGTKYINNKSLAKKIVGLVKEHAISEAQKAKSQAEKLMLQLEQEI